MNQVLAVSIGESRQRLDEVETEVGLGEFETAGLKLLLKLVEISVVAVALRHDNGVLLDPGSGHLERGEVLVEELTMVLILTECLILLIFRHFIISQVHKLANARLARLLVDD